MSLKIHSGVAAALIREQLLFIPVVAKVQRHVKYIGGACIASADI